MNLLTYTGFCLYNFNVGCKKCVSQVIHILLFEKCHREREELFMLGLTSLVSGKNWSMRIKLIHRNNCNVRNHLAGTVISDYCPFYQLADEKLWIFILFSQNTRFKKIDKPTITSFQCLIFPIIYLG